MIATNVSLSVVPLAAEIHAPNSSCFTAPSSAFKYICNKMCIEVLHTLDSLCCGMSDSV